MKAALLLLLQLPLWGVEFEKFGALPLSAQATSGVVSAGIGYLFLKNSVEPDPATGATKLTTGQTLIGLSLGYTLGILFSGKLFQGQGNPFFTLIGNLVPFIGPLFAYHLSAGSSGFSEALALFNLEAGKLSLGLPVPYRKTGGDEQPADTRYYLNLVIINL
jgi:hypothetical protein